MKVLYLHQYFNTPQMAGGTRSYMLARRLVEAGHEVHMITSRRDGRGAGKSGWTRTEEDGIHVHWVRVPYSNRMGFWRRIAAFFQFAWSAARKAAALDGDVVFATSTPLTIALPGVYAARKRRVPMVFEVRDLWPTSPIAIGALRNRFLITAARWLERFAYRHAARVVALSPGMRDGVTAVGYPPERVSVIPNISEIDFFGVDPESGRAIRARYDWLGPRPLVIYAGALGHVNGVDYLARVAAAAAPLDPEIRFLVLGKGKEEERVRAEAERLGVLDRNFFMLPAVPKSELPAWLSAADITTSTVINIKELWPDAANKFFDALAAGRPVAINYGGWQADLLRESGAGLVLDAHDQEAAAADLVRALRDEQWMARAGAAARKLAERFSPERAGTMLEQVFKAALEESGGAHRTVRLLRAANRAPAAGSPVKRILDFSAAVAGLLFLSPVLLLIALAVRLGAGAPVLFRQRRPGLGGRPFTILKFRTLRAGRGPDAERMTRFGRFLRRWSLDELPELLNVLGGEMSLVGPRPLLVEYLDRYTPEQAQRHEVRPGITGWAQVNGRNARTWEERFKLDVWYVENRSLPLDIKILLLTIVKVVSGEGVSAAGHATMPRFTGDGPRAGHAQAEKENR